MRLADVVWSRSRFEQRTADLKDKDGKPHTLIFDEDWEWYTAFDAERGMGGNRTLSTNKPLELACWLADKEPCEPTSSSASSSTT